MDLGTLLQLLIAVMFSPPGIAVFIISTILKIRWHASIAAVIGASAFMFMNGAVFSQQTSANYTVVVVASVVGMMIAAHLAFTLGEKIIRKNKEG